MINTTELRRLRDVAIEGPLVISAQYMQVMSATTGQFVSCTADGTDDPECLLICYAFNNAHAIADELDALREWKAIEQQHLISSATALMFAGWRGDGSVTDAVKWACGELDALRAENRAMQNRMSLTAMAICSGDESDDWELTDQRWTAKAYENAKELDELRRRVAELEAALNGRETSMTIQTDEQLLIVAATYSLWSYGRGRKCLYVRYGDDGREFHGIELLNGVPVLTDEARRTLRAAVAYEEGQA